MSISTNNLKPSSSPLYFTVVERTNGWRDKYDKWHEIEEEKSLVRNGADNEPIWLANVGKDYKVVQNRELLEYIADVLIKTLSVGQLAGAYIDDEVSFGGRYSYRTFCFPSMEVQVAGRLIHFRVYVANGFGGSAVQFMSGAYELVCTNGMIVGFADRTVRKHTSGINIPDLGKWVSQSVSAFANASHKWVEWAETHITDERVQQFLQEEPTISARLAERMMDRWSIEAEERGSTAWALYNALTHYATHNLVSPLRDTGNDHAAKTVMDRHRQVNKWVNGAKWQKYIGATLGGGK